MKKEQMQTAQGGLRMCHRMVPGGSAGQNAPSQLAKMPPGRLCP